MTKMLRDQVAVVTGAAGGLGSEICRVFEEEGARVVRVDIQGEDCLHADVATADGNRRMIEEAIARHRRLDTLVLNAGDQSVAPISAFPEVTWDLLMNVMVKSAFLAIKCAWPYLTERPGGRIIATGSTLSLIGAPGKVAYVAAKHGLLGVIKVAALEGAAAGLTANVVAPGWMNTSLLERQLDDLMHLKGMTRDEVLDSLKREQAADRFVEPREVADAIAFLASPRASGITGSCIPVDLGDLCS
jgi:3-hydroxybutyrate dehydrogenase